MSKDRIERRKEERFDVDIQVDYSTKDIFVSNTMTNLCRGGIFIQTDHPAPLQTVFRLKFTLPLSAEKIEVTGKVVWTYDIKKGTSLIRPGMGIRFIDLSSDHKARLEAYIENLSKSPDLKP